MEKSIFVEFMKKNWKFIITTILTIAGLGIDAILYGFEHIKSFLLFIWTELLNAKFPIWIIIAVILVVSWLFNIYKKSNSKIEPTFLNYKKDKIKGFEWKWDYSKNAYGLYEITGLKPVCKVCSRKMYYPAQDRHWARCSEDDSFIYDAINLNEIKAIITSRIDNEDFLNSYIILD